MWEHAPSMEMPLSKDALQFARKLAASKYTYPDDRLAVELPGQRCGQVQPIVGGRARKEVWQRFVNRASR